MNPRLAALLSENESQSHFFDGVRFVRQQELSRKKLEYSWESNGYKLYPSAITSLTMCPHRYVNVDVHKPPGFLLENVYKMEAGKYMHTMYQTEALKLQQFLWCVPDFSHYEPGLRDRMATKLGEIWPEVPVFCTHSAISGRADAVLNINDEPVVFDIKTTSVADVQKEMKADPETKKKVWTGNWLEGCWKKYIEDNLPKKEHELQVMIYCYLMNKMHYYSKPIRRAGLGYLNLLMDAGNSEAEHEHYFDFTEELEQKVGLLIYHLGLERRNYLEGIDSQCSYPNCRQHFLKAKKDK